MVNTQDGARPPLYPDTHIELPDPNEGVPERAVVNVVAAQLKRDGANDTDIAAMFESVDHCLHITLAAVLSTFVTVHHKTRGE